MNFVRDEYRVRGYQEVITPLVFNKELWETSGHWQNYKDDMFAVTGASHAHGNDHAHAGEGHSCAHHHHSPPAGKEDVRSVSESARRERVFAVVMHAHPVFFSRAGDGPQTDELPGALSHLLRRTLLLPRPSAAAC